MLLLGSILNNGKIPEIINRLGATFITGLILAYYNLNTSKIFKNAFLSYIGDISYLLYLVHWPTIQFFNYYGALNDSDPSNNLFIKFASFGLSLLISIILHHIFEKPLLSLRSYQDTALISTVICQILTIWITIYISCNSSILSHDIYTWKEFSSKVLRGFDEYKNLEMVGYKPDLSGWNPVSDFFPKILKQVAQSNNIEDDTIRIFEVGSYKGLSTSSMGNICKQLEKEIGKKCAIVSIDTWIWADQSSYATFVKNMKSIGLDDIVSPLRMRSDLAARLLNNYKIFADIIFIDADHSYEGCKRDLELFYPLLKKHGIMYGDDYTIHGVNKAVNEFVKGQKLIINEAPDKIHWIMNFKE
uniref:Acyltransferase 3 domain-containing protein n=1 Tax=Acrobeloides nanus TaxID=290746 RepID=A0A914EIC0_9BILA